MKVIDFYLPAEGIAAPKTKSETPIMVDSMRIQAIGIKTNASGRDLSYGRPLDCTEEEISLQKTFVW